MTVVMSFAVRNVKRTDSLIANLTKNEQTYVFLNGSCARLELRVIEKKERFRNRFFIQYAQVYKLQEV